MYSSRRWLRPRPVTPCPPDQVFNGKDSLWPATVTPKSPAAAAAVSAAWAPLVHGQVVPRLGERVPDDQTCLDV